METKNLTPKFEELKKMLHEKAMLLRYTLRHSSRAFNLLVMAALLVGVVSGVYLVRNNISFFQQAAGPNASLSMTFSSPVTVNQPFVVPVLVNPDSNNLVGMDIRIIFNPSQLQLTKVDPVITTSTSFKTIAPDTTTVVTKANQNGVIDFSALTYDGTALTAPYTNSTYVVVANLTFNPLTAGSSVLKFDYDPNKPGLSTDSNLVNDSNPPKDVLASTTDLTLTINTATGNAPTPVLNVANSTSVVTNPGFESNNTTGWTVSGTNSVVTLGHSGTYGDQLSGQSAYLSQNIAGKLTAGVPYTFSGWVKTTTPGTSWGQPTLRLSKYQDLGTGDYGQFVAQSNSNWQILSFTHTFTTTELSGAVYFGIKNFGFTGIELFDDATVSSTGLPSSTPTPTTGAGNGNVSTPTPVPTSTPKPTSSPTPTPTKAGVTSTVTYTVGGSSDAVNQDGLTFSNTSPMWIGNAQSTSFAAFRFTNVNIPQNAKINSAYLKVYSTQSQWISIAFTFYGEAAGNSNTFSSSSTPASRSLTGSSVSHSSDVSWSASTWYNLDSINSVVQEIISRSDWKSGNALSLILKGTGPTWGRKFVAGSSAQAPQLVVSYTTQ